MEILRRMVHGEDCFVIAVTHDPEAAEASDLVLSMKDGLMTTA